MNSITALIQNIKNNFRNEMLSNTVMPENITTIQSIARKYKNGCSVANQLLLSQERESWQWGPTPRSHMTYLREQITNISALDMSRAFEKVRATNVTPAVQWTSTQILLRTIWTRVKESNTRRNINNQALVNDLCSNCGTAPERTMHLFYECPLASAIWNRALEIYNQVMSRTQNFRNALPVQLNLDLIIFHKFPDNLPKMAANDLNDIILMGKHVIYRFKFGENSERHPSLRLTTITLALELERLVEVRKKKGEIFSDMETIINEMKRLEGF